MMFKKSMFRKSGVILVLMLGMWLVVGCNSSVPEAATPSPEPAPTLTVTPLPLVEETEIPVGGTVTLNVWVPPQFAPSADSLAGQLLQAQFDAFAARRAGVQVVTRVKNVEGPGGIEDTLKTASTAAPLALPDLVALPYANLQSAAADGLLHTFDGLTDVMDDLDWYDFARQLSHVQNKTFGIPFASDVLVLAYRPEAVEETYANWAALLEGSQTLAFAAADPTGLLPLTYYRAGGGAVVDEEGQPILNMAQLAEVLTFFYQGSRNEVFPFWLTQYENNDQVWAAFSEHQTDMAVTWASQHIQMPQDDTQIAVIPTADGTPNTSATGWVWALTATEPERQAIAAELAAFLAAGDFLTEWSLAVGYLPPRPSALTAWEDTPFADVFNQALPTAQLLPPTEILTTIGPLLSSSTVEVLKDQVDPTTAAQKAVDGLTAP